MSEQQDMQDVQNMQEESWFAVAKDKISTRISGFFRRNKGKFIFAAVVLLLLLVLFRAVWQPFFLTLREYSFVFIVLAAYFILLAILGKIQVTLKILVPFSLVIFASLTIYALSDAPKYLAAYAIC